MMIDSSRMDNELIKMKQELESASDFRNKAVDAANKYIERMAPILKKRGIKIASTQMYFNSIDNRHNHALAILEFTEQYGDYKSTKVRHLEKELFALKIPRPIGSASRGITMTLYDETLNR